jgi:hypothetical protein
MLEDFGDIDLDHELESLGQGDEFDVPEGSLLEILLMTDNDD